MTTPSSLFQCLTASAGVTPAPVGPCSAISAGSNPPLGGDIFGTLLTGLQASVGQEGGVPLQPGLSQTTFLSAPTLLSPVPLPDNPLEASADGIACPSTMPGDLAAGQPGFNDGLQLQLRARVCSGETPSPADSTDDSQSPSCNDEKAGGTGTDKDEGSHGEEVLAQKIINHRRPHGVPPGLSRRFGLAQDTVPETPADPVAATQDCATAKSAAGTSLSDVAVNSTATEDKPQPREAGLRLGQVPVCPPPDVLLQPTQAIAHVPLTSTHQASQAPTAGTLSASANEGTAFVGRTVSLGMGQAPQAPSQATPLQTPRTAPVVVHGQAPRAPMPQLAPQAAPAADRGVTAAGMAAEDLAMAGTQTKWDTRQEHVGAVRLGTAPLRNDTSAIDLPAGNARAEANSVTSQTVPGSLQQQQVTISAPKAPASGREIAASLRLGRAPVVGLQGSVASSQVIMPGTGDLAERQQPPVAMGVQGREQALSHAQSSLQTALSHGFGLSAQRGENSAAGPVGTTEGDFVVFQKKSQMTDEDIEGISTKSLGIGGAESVGNMSLTPSNKPAAEETPRVSQAPWLLEGLGRLAAGEELSGAKAGAVERSQAEVFVERVERAVETLQTRPERVVHLHLGEGSEEKLSVRLQLRDGMIHTTFVTASEEMRSTLSREWGHSLAASLGSDSSLRVAEPVFSSHERGENSGGNSGAQADAQKQQQQAQENSSAARGNAQYAGHSRSSKQADAHPAVGSGETVHDETSSRLLHAMA